MYFLYLPDPPPRIYNLTSIPSLYHLSDLTDLFTVLTLFLRFSVEISAADQLLIEICNAYRNNKPVPVAALSKT